jgi:hypothetical protein
MNDQKRIARTAPSVSRSQPTADICDVFLTEMRLRRERLRELLRLVETAAAIEADKHSRAQRPRAARASHVRSQRAIGVKSLRAIGAKSHAAAA